MRSFIAVDISPTPEIRNLIADLKQNLRGLDLKYTEINNYHITLSFLGEIPDVEVNAICKDLGMIIFNRIELSLAGLGVFKSGSNPQVVWIGIKTDDNFIKLWEHVNQTISNYGFKTDKREFSPHLTIGRVRKALPYHNLSLFLEKNKHSFFGKFSINEFIFYQSILTPQGPIYKSIKKFGLTH
ncbi:MAG TPA: RNA 2',3'-cyclic phosphodiesterase [Bacteroidales bacterium]